MKKVLVFILILCMFSLLSVGAQNTDPASPKEIVVESEPAIKTVTNLDVKIIDEINDKMVELNNCIVQVIGELHICEDSFNYSNSFTEGNKYEMIIWVKLKK